MWLFVREIVLAGKCEMAVSGLLWTAYVSSQGKEKFILSQLANYEDVAVSDIKEHIRKNGMVDGDRKILVHSLHKGFAVSVYL